MSTLSKVREDSSQLHYRQNYWLGIVFFIIGSGVCFVPQITDKATGEIWVVYVVGGVFALIGLGIALYRFEIKIDLLNRRYHMTYGFVLSLKTSKGTFADFEGVTLTKVWRTSGGKNKTKYVVWQTGLQIKGHKKSVVFSESRDEVRERKNFETRSAQLQIAAIDNTGSQPLRREWNQLDDSVENHLAAKQFSEVRYTSPPDGLEFHRHPRGIAYQTKTPGVGGGVLLGVLFGLPFFAMGLFSMIIGSGLHKTLGWTIKVSGSMGAALFMGAIFTLVGGAVIKFSIDHAFKKLRFVFTDQAIGFETILYGNLSKTQEFRYSDVEDFGLRESTQSRHRKTAKVGGLNMGGYGPSVPSELFLRTDSEVAIFRDLNQEQGEYLRNVFYQRLSEKKKAS